MSGSSVSALPTPAAHGRPAADGPWRAGSGAGGRSRPATACRGETARSGSRLASIDALRGLAVLAVVFMHVASNLNSPSPLVASIIAVLTPVRMPLLMTISGMLASGLRHQPARAMRRAAGLAWLVVCWLPFELTLRRVAGMGGGSWYAEMLGPPNELWFVWGLALLIGTLPCVGRAGAAGAMPVAFAASALLPRGGHLNIAYLEMMYNAVFFYGGVFFAARWRTLLGASPWRWCGWLAVFAVAHAANAALIGRTGHYWLMPVESFAAIGLCLCGGEWLARLPIADRLTWLGRRTLPIYIAHAPLIRLGAWALPHPGFGAVVLLTAVMVTATLMLEKALKAIGLGGAYDGEQAARSLTASRARIAAWLARDAARRGGAVA
ncbi:acyltransferase family protein [uncultured Sphingomonas sp.]|uniref:acyltransferase family protein n=1 Tax=uncultured Sphingomonas sp. TaxID=158754 RepID=UPI0035CC2E6A